MHYKNVQIFAVKNYVEWGVGYTKLSTEPIAPRYAARLYSDRLEYFATRNPFNKNFDCFTEEAQMSEASLQKIVSIPYDQLEKVQLIRGKSALLIFTKSGKKLALRAGDFSKQKNTLQALFEGIATKLKNPPIETVKVNLLESFLSYWGIFLLGTIMFGITFLGVIASPGKSILETILCIAGACMILYALKILICRQSAMEICFAEN